MVSILMELSIGVLDHFRGGRGEGGGGGAHIFCPNRSSLPEKSNNMFGQCIFAAHALGGGGGRVKESNSFEVIGHGTPESGWVWDPPPTVGTF